MVLPLLSTDGGRTNSQARPRPDEVEGHLLQGLYIPQSDIRANDRSIAGQPQLQGETGWAGGGISFDSLYLSHIIYTQNLTDSTVYILSEVYKDRTAMARSLVRIFHALSKVCEHIRTCTLLQLCHVTCHVIK